jgi:hypothetical protein
VLRTIEEYRRLSGTNPMSALDALRQEGGPEYDVDVVFERSRDLPREIDFGLD